MYSVLTLKYAMRVPTQSAGLMDICHMKNKFPQHDPTIITTCTCTSALIPTGSHSLPSALHHLSYERHMSRPPPTGFHRRVMWLVLRLSSFPC